MNLGNKITQLRESEGMTQEELASEIGISRGALCHYEKNRREPSIETIVKLADFFEVSVDYIFERTQNPRLH